MKELVLKGHPLTKKESEEVKGGTYYPLHNVTNPPPEPFMCDVCEQEVYLFIYDASTGYYTAICSHCGCRKKVKMEE